eukprot:m.148319 g.148319  ORF g.148319 m.148319 type:complete len:422 (-) comp13253_c0_seq2:150-1415(-)
MNFCFIFVALVAIVSMAAMAEETSFKRERRTLETAAMALESLRSALATQENNIFAASASLRNVATQADVTAVEEGVWYLESRINSLADEETVNNMTDTVTDAIQNANTANILAREVSESLPPLRSRSEAALDSSLSLLKHFASHEVSVVSFEKAFQEEWSDFRDAVESVADASDNFLSETNLTAPSNDFHKRADALIAFMEDIDVDSYNTIRDSMALTNYLDPQQPVFRWRTWHSYSYSNSWYAGNNADRFGGVNPSEWADSHGYAYEMSSDMDVLRSFFTQRMVTGFSANVFSQEWYYSGSTDASHTAALFRIRNTSPSAITWNIRYYYFNYGSWEEASSIAVNKQNYYTYTSNCGSCSASVNVVIPSDGVSTVIVIGASSNPSSTRGSGIAFYDDCLSLPNGLEYVDDLPVATSLFEAN